MQLAAITPDNVFHGVQLTVRERQRPAHHSLVSDIRDFSAVRQEILASLLNFLDDRFSADASVKLEPLAQIDQNVSDDQLKDMSLWFQTWICASFVWSTEKLQTLSSN